MTAFIRRHASVLAVLLVAAISAATIAAVVWEARTRERQVEDAREERLGQICVSIMDNRDALLELTGVVLAGESAPLPLTSLPEFDQLEPRTQTYLHALAAQTGGGAALRARIDAFRTGLLAAPLPEFCQ